MGLFAVLPRPPHARLLELLRRLALLSAAVALLSVVWSSAPAAARLLAVASLLALGVMWHLARARRTWSLAERIIEGTLLAVIVSVAAAPAMALPAIYGGLNFRALGRGKRAAFSAVVVYLLAFAVALAIRHAHDLHGMLADLSIVLPGVPFCAVLLHALSAALRGKEEAESRLQESESHLRRLVDEAPIGIVSLSNDDLVTMWNPAAERLLGWSAPEVMGRPLPTVPADGHSAFAELRARDRRGERTSEIEIPCLHKNGTLVDLLASSAPLLNSSGEVQGTIGLLADVTERKALESQLRQSQKMEAVGQLAGGIAHDFNNLLTVILAHAEFLKKATGAGSEHHADIDEIRGAANRAAGLTHQLLAFSRKQVLRPVVLDLNSTVLEFTSLMQRVLGEDITIVNQVDAEPILVRADRGQLEQVAMNLAVNARDAMPFGGSLTIETGVVHDAQRAVLSGDGVLPLGSYAVLTVRDTGSGMSPEVQSRIFEPFFTTKEVGRGTGLGLSTVFGIVAQSNGFLAVESSLGLGTAFHIYLPLQALALVPAQHAPRPAVKAWSGTETILLAEDSDQLRELTRRVLERQGYTVIAAADGVEALEAAAAFAGRIDLVLTDAVMPRVGGGELVRTLREMRDDFRVLYMTGYTEDDLVRRGVGANEGDVLRKPFTPETLAARVRLVLHAQETAVAC